LLESELSRDLPTDEQFIGVRRRGIAHSVRNAHRCVLEQDKTDFIESTRLESGLEACRFSGGIVPDYIFVGDIVSELEPVPWMDVRRREDHATKSAQLADSKGFLSLTEAKKEPYCDCC
jgi:hypothetical protein